MTIAIVIVRRVARLIQRHLAVTGNWNLLGLCLIRHDAHGTEKPQDQPRPKHQGEHPVRTRAPAGSIDSIVVWAHRRIMRALKPWRKGAKKALQRSDPKTPLRFHSQSILICLTKSYGGYFMYFIILPRPVSRIGHSLEIVQPSWQLSPYQPGNPIARTSRVSSPGSLAWQ